MKTYLNNLEKDVLSMMIDNLYTLEGYDGNVSDIAFDLFACENASGSITYSAWRATEWIKDHFEDLGDVVEEVQNEGDIKLNPFSNPEAFQVQVVLYLAEQLVDQSPYLARGLYEEECDAITYDTETLNLIHREWEEALNR